MKVFKAEEAKARVAEFNAEQERINQKRADEAVEKIFDEIRNRSANGSQCITFSLVDIGTKNRVIEILKEAGYEVQDDFTRIWVNWGE